jgi:hypothetical protein
VEYLWSVFAWGGFGEGLSGECFEVVEGGELGLGNREIQSNGKVKRSFTTFRMTVCLGWSVSMAGFVCDGWRGAKTKAEADSSAALRNDNSKK